MKHFITSILLLNCYLLHAQTQLGSDIDGEAAGDASGVSVSINSAGDRVAIGAYGNDGTGSYAGHVRIYEYSNSSWSQLGSDIDGEAAGDYSGRSVSLNSAGDRVTIGAYGNDGTGSGAGHVRIYEYSNSSWSQLGSDIDGEAADDRSGNSVSINSAGDRVAIGAPYNGGTGSNAGHVRVYSLSSINLAPVLATIEDQQIAEDSVLTVEVSATSVLSYSMSFTATSDTSDVAVSLEDTTLTATPSLNWFGISVITVIATDENELSDTTDFTLTVNAVNDAPVAYDDTIMVDHNTDFVGALIASDVDDVEYSFYLLSSPSSGNVTVSVEGSYVYSPRTDFSGSDSFTFTVCDYSLCDTATVLITIHPLSIDETSLPTEYAIHQNYPNPFNPITTLRYDLPENSLVKITVYDMLGREVKTLINQTQDAGYRSVIWNATNDYGKPVSAGIYIYQIQAGEYNSTKKMVLLK